MLTSRENSPLWQAQRRIEPVTLHHAGQWAQNTTDWAILAPAKSSTYPLLQWLLSHNSYRWREYTETQCAQRFISSYRVQRSWCSCPRNMPSMCHSQRPVWLPVRWLSGEISKNHFSTVILGVLGGEQRRSGRKEKEWKEGEEEEEEETDKCTVCTGYDSCRKRGGGERGCSGDCCSGRCQGARVGVGEADVVNGNVPSVGSSSDPFHQHLYENRQNKILSVLFCFELGVDRSGGFNGSVSFAWIWFRLAFAGWLHTHHQLLKSRRSVSMSMINLQIILIICTYNYPNQAKTSTQEKSNSISLRQNLHLNLLKKKKGVRKPSSRACESTQCSSCSSRNKGIYTFTVHIITTSIPTAIWLWSFNTQPCRLHWQRQHATPLPRWEYRREGGGGEAWGLQPQHVEKLLLQKWQPRKYPLADTSRTRWCAKDWLTDIALIILRTWHQCQDKRKNKKWMDCKKKRSLQKCEKKAKQEWRKIQTTN